jgi:hypothetical protein
MVANSAQDSESKLGHYPQLGSKRRLIHPADASRRRELGWEFGPLTLTHIKDGVRPTPAFFIDKARSLIQFLWSRPN